MPGTLNRPSFWHSLLRLGSKPQVATPSGLGLDALPQGLGQLPVGTPVALAWQDGAPGLPGGQTPGPAPGLLWAQALLQDLLLQGPVFLLAQSQASVDALLQQPALALAHDQRRLGVWLMADALSQARAPVAMHAVFGELQQAGLCAAHALVVLASPEAQLGPSVAAVQQWGRQIGNWCQRRTRPVVFAFNAWDGAEQVLGPLRSLATVFQHVALLGSQPRGPLLFVERWNGSDGPIFELRLGLRQAADNPRLAYDGSQTQGADQHLVEAPDQFRVIATQAAVAGQRAVPANWTLVEDLPGMLAAAADAVGATVLLHSGVTQQQDALLHTVYQLRSQRGRSLKIVVYETQDKLRSNLEQALLNLGANHVVYREVGFARLLRQLDDMNDETFVHAIPADFASARAGFMPDPVRGYLPTLAFCDSVQAMLGRTGPRGLRHSFLRLTMQRHVAHLDAIQACVALRDGDVLSTDQNALYVFMFACAETDVDPALARLFSIAPSELFAGQTLFGSVDGVQAVLRALREAARKGVPDYSAYRSTRTASAPQSAAPGAGPSAAPIRTVGALHALPEPADAATVELALPSPTVHARPLARRGATQPQGAVHAA